MLKFALATMAVLALAIPDADARGGSGRGHSGRSHHHHHGGAKVFVFGSRPVFYGAPLYTPVPADPYWYYCRAANAYYPYVQNCPGGWERYLPGTPLG